MSAAIYAEAAADEAHQGLGPITVRREQLPGRAPRPKARLVVWGETDEARRYAEHDGRADQGLTGYLVTDVEQSPVRVDQPAEHTWIAYGGAPDWAWIAYELNDH